MANSATAKRSRSRTRRRRARGSTRTRRHHLLHQLARRLSEHKLSIYASAIAFRAIVSVIPLVLLGLGLLGALGLKSTWHDSIAPVIKPRVTGSLLVIAVWVLASLLFRLWITDVASFKSPIGSLTGLLVLTFYFFVSSAIFLIGAELDELLRTR